MNREHSDAVSKLMGQYLLKGYALLDQYCGHCETPLMRDLSGNLVCLSCKIKGKDVPPIDVSKMEVPSGDSKATPHKNSNTNHMEYSLDSVEEALLSKLSWASRMLSSQSSVKECLDVSNLIASLLESLHKIRQLTQK